MKNIFLFIYFYLLLIATCSFPPYKKHSSQLYQNVQEKINSKEITFSGGDGSSIENAIFIDGPISDEELSASEQIYVRNKNGMEGKDWEICSHLELRGKEEQDYDLIEIMNLKENKKDFYYFDSREAKIKIYLIGVYKIYPVVENKIKDKLITFSGGDGSSPEKSIEILGAKSNEEMFASKLIYFSTKFGIKGEDWDILSNEITINENKVFEILEVSNLKDNTVVPFHFVLLTYKK